VVFATEGPLKKLYERIRSQRENWQQRSMHVDSRDADAAADDDVSHSVSALHRAVIDREGGSFNLVHLFNC